VSRFVPRCQHRAANPDVSLGSADCTEPSSLPVCFNGACVVILANPGHGLFRRKTVKDGQRGQRCSCATDAAAADNFDAFPVVSTAESLVQGVEGLDPVSGNPEIPLVRPGCVCPYPNRR